MRDIVIVPAYERPEYTWVCLEYIAGARGAGDKEIWLCQDQHTGAPDVIEAMRPVAAHGATLFGDRFIWRMLDPHNTYGNSKNLLVSLKNAYKEGAERIFLIEDDIMVAPDIFEWHEAILREVDPFVSCATELKKSAHFQINGRYTMDDCSNPNAYYRTWGPYSSHAAAFTRENLKEVIDRFATPEWYESFSQGREQDIAIQSMMKTVTFPNRGSAWPYVPRAFNVGIYSYHINTGMKFAGTLEEKIAGLRRAMKDPELLKRVSANNQAITPVPIFGDRPTPSNLIRRQERQ